MLFLLSVRLYGAASDGDFADFNTAINDAVSHFGSVALWDDGLEFFFSSSSVGRRFIKLDNAIVAVLLLFGAHIKC